MSLNSQKVITWLASAVVIISFAFSAYAVEEVRQANRHTEKKVCEVAKVNHQTLDTLVGVIRRLHLEDADLTPNSNKARILQEISVIKRAIESTNLKCP